MSTAYQPRLSRGKHTKPVTLSDGSTVTIRKLTQGEVETIRRNYSADAKTIEGVRFIACKVTLDEQGNRVWQDSDLPNLVEEDYEDLQTIAAECIEFSGLTKKAADAKNESAG
jgi:hypothetical protein